MVLQEALGLMSQLRDDFKPQKVGLRVPILVTFQIKRNDLFKNIIWAILEV